MKVLYIYPKHNDLIHQHVQLLVQGLQQSVDITQTTDAAMLRRSLRKAPPDIIHCHGCSSFSLAQTVLSAVNGRIRLIVTPHGELEPWATRQQSLTEKAAKRLSWQKGLLSRAYAVILLGRLERTNFLRLNWNSRTEEIHNAVITNTISPLQMCNDTFAVYQKVLDSDTIELMDDTTRRMLQVLIKVGIMGDRRWARVLPDGNVNWRQLLLYADHEHIRNYVDYGMSLIGLSTPAIDTSAIKAYFPDNYTLPQPINNTIGDYTGNETDYLLRIITKLHRQPTLLNLIELTRELYRDTVNDEQLCQVLDDRKLTDYASSLMQLLSEQTALDEGYMPLPPVDNRQTRQLRKLLTNHLKI